MGLSAGRAYPRGGGLICGSNKASETTDITRQSEYVYVKMKKMYRIIRLFTH